MRLTAKLTVTLTLAMIAVLAVNGWVRLEREVDLFEAGMRKHAHVFGRALGNDVGWAWRTAGEKPALQLVEDANEKNSDLEVRWVWLDAGAIDPYRPRSSVSELEQVRQGHEISIRRPTPEGPNELFTYVPVSLPHGRIGALQITESLRAQDEFKQTVSHRVFRSMVTLVLILTALSVVLGAVFVGRPTRALVRKAIRIGGGNLAEPIVLTQRDELGEIAAAMNSMCDQLAAARERASAESAARLAALEQLRHADRLMTVGKLSSGIAHELGTPLNVVAGRAQMIASGESAGAEAADSARIVVEQSKRMTQIIRQLLDFARPRRSQKSSTDLLVLAKQTVSLLETMARNRGVSLVHKGSQALPRIDAGQIQQALTNLVVNAIHATSAGGQITIDLDRVEAQPPPDHGGERAVYVRLRVSDTGHGMDAATVARVFEPFFTTKEVGEGTGLGLSVTYGIVKEHGGWIAVESEQRSGSTFSIYLPQDEGEVVT